MTVKDFRKILEDYKGKKTTFYKASFCVENKTFIIYTNCKWVRGYAKVDSILNFIKDEEYRLRNCNYVFDNFEVKVKDSILGKSYRLCEEAEYSDYLKKLVFDWQLAVEDGGLILFDE